MNSKKIELLNKLYRQGQLIKFWSRFLFSLMLLAWLIFGIWALITKKNDLVEKVFWYLLIFTLLFSLLAGIVFASLWSVWDTGAELGKLV